MTHSSITTSRNPSDQQTSVAENPNSSTQLRSRELAFNGDRVYLAVKNKIKNSSPQENNNDYIEEINLINFFRDNRNFLNAKNLDNGNNALHVAIFENDLEVVKIITALGINRDEQNHENKNPLQLANLLGFKEISKYLGDLKHSDRSLDEVYLQAYRPASNPSNSVTQAQNSTLSLTRSFDR